MSLEAKLSTLLTLLLLTTGLSLPMPSGAAAPQATAQSTDAAASHPASQTAIPSALADPMPVATFLERGVAWLAAAQFPQGGWGAGSHMRQDIRDPHMVQIDPATTALAAMALVRAGNTVSAGPYRDNVHRALQYLLQLVESAPAEGPQITTISGTQPQVKLGQHIDVSMTVQFFSRLLPHLNHDSALGQRVTRALDICLHKLEAAQGRDGSWSGQAWAPVLQSAMADSALETAQAAGRPVSSSVVQRSKDYQKSNVQAATGEVRTEKAAGVTLYALSSNQRAVAREVREAERTIADAKARQVLQADADVSVDNLVKAGYEEGKAQQLYDAHRQNETTQRLLQEEGVLAGFGNNGGEEYLSYMMISESLVLNGGEKWAAWHQTMSRRFAKVQNADGSWSGHHCITSPVFSTAAVVMALTADREATMLRQEQQRRAKVEP